MDEPIEESKEEAAPVEEEVPAVENGHPAAASSHKPSPVKSEAPKPEEPEAAKAPLTETVVCEGDVCRIVKPGEDADDAKPY